MATPTITNPAVSDDPIKENQQLTVTADETNTDEAFVVFYDPKGSGDIIYSQHMVVDGGTISAVIPPNSLDVGTYNAIAFGVGAIKIKAINESSLDAAIDDTLTLVVEKKVTTGDSVIFQLLKETARDMMIGFKKVDNITAVWDGKVKEWYVVNVMSVPTSRYPCVFFVMPRHGEEYHSITRKKRFDMELQIEFYFWDYNENDEELALEWIEELSRMIRTMPLHPYVNQPDPAKFKVLDWVLNDSNIDYFNDDGHILMSVLCSTTVTLLDCRSIT